MKKKSRFRTPLSAHILDKSLLLLIKSAEEGVSSSSTTPTTSPEQKPSTAPIAQTPTPSPSPKPLETPSSPEIKSPTTPTTPSTATTSPALETSTPSLTPPSPPKPPTSPSSQTTTTQQPTSLAFEEEYDPRKILTYIGIPLSIVSLLQMGLKGESSWSILGLTLGIIATLYGTGFINRVLPGKSEEAIAKEIEAKKVVNYLEKLIQDSNRYPIFKTGANNSHWTEVNKDIKEAFYNVGLSAANLIYVVTYYANLKGPKYEEGDVFGTYTYRRFIEEMRNDPRYALMAMDLVNDLVEEINRTPDRSLTDIARDVYWKRLSTWGAYFNMGLLEFNAVMTFGKLKNKIALNIIEKFPKNFERLKQVIEAERRARS